jgi:hypothetical protein
MHSSLLFPRHGRSLPLRASVSLTLLNSSAQLGRHRSRRTLTTQARVGSASRQTLQPVVPEASTTSMDTVTSAPGLGDAPAERRRLACKTRTPTGRTTCAKAAECYLCSRVGLICYLCTRIAPMNRADFLAGKAAPSASVQISLRARLLEAPASKFPCRQGTLERAPSQVPCRQASAGVQLPNFLAGKALLSVLHRNFLAGKG